MEYSPLHSLCESITDCPHSTPEWTTSGKVVIRNQNIKNGKLDLSSPSYTTTHDFQRRIVRAKPTSGDIIITREAPMGEACLVPEGLECCLGQRMVLLKPDEKQCNNRYLLYAILSPYVQNQISWSYGTGTTVSNLRIPHLETLKIPCPNRSVQDSIAATLSCLDDKIELNNRIIANLEAQAQAIFKSWFVDFEPFQDGEFEESELGLIPKGWRVGGIYELCDVIYGAPYKSELFNQKMIGLPLIRIRDLKTFTPQMWTDEMLPKSEHVNRGDIVFGMDAEFRPCVWKGSGGLLNQRVCKVKPRNNSVSHYYIYFTLNPILYGIEQYKTGTTVSHIGKSDLDRILVTIAPESILLDFKHIVEPMYELILKISSENDALTDSRDTLLPKLMSGEIEVPVEG